MSALRPRSGIRRCAGVAALVAVAAAGGWLISRRSEAAATWVFPGANVLLISIDTLRADHLGAYGYRAATSPRLDVFARESFLFENAIAQAPSTEPSHASIFTSLLPVRHGALRAYRQGIASNVATLPEIFRRGGYRTVSFNGGGQVAASFGFGRGFEVYQSTGGDFADQVAAAILWLQEHGGERFFMFLHTFEVHAPYDAGHEYLDPLDGDYRGPLPDNISPRLLSDIAIGRTTLSPADLAHVVAAYDAQIRSMDDAFGHLVDYLRKSGRERDTIVLFLSDHGEELGEHGQVGEHSLSLQDEVLRVPMILRLPAGREGGRRIAAQVRGIDVLPTLLELTGLEAPAGIEGASLVARMAGRFDPVDRLAVSQMDLVEETPPAAVRTDQDKLIVGSRDLVDAPLARWFADQTDLEVETALLLLRVESFGGPRQLRITTPSRGTSVVTIDATPRIFKIWTRSSDRQTIRLQASGSCTPTGDAAAAMGLPCASFRISNPHAYYRLRDDPLERENLYGRPEVAARSAELEARLRALVPLGVHPQGTAAEEDRKTREQLRALGYLR